MRVESHPFAAEVALRRLVERARRSGESVEPEEAALLSALHRNFTVDEATVDRVARVIWARWRNVSPRGFNATSEESKRQWRALATAALEELGHELVVLDRTA